MDGGAIPATGRRTIHPAWESISRRSQARAAALRVDVARGVGGWSAHHLPATKHRSLQRSTSNPRTPRLAVAGVFTCPCPRAGATLGAMARRPGAITMFRRRILELGRSAQDADAFRRELRPILARLVPFDGYCVNTADPATLLVTGSVGDGLPPDKARRLFEIEYLVPDYSKLAELAVRDANVAVLGDETGHRPESSARMREVFHDVGYAHELRCALRLGG